MEIIKYILAIYSWAAIGILLIFLGRVAYFYEKTSGQPTGYYLLFLPALLLVAGACWYLVTNVEFTGQPIGDLLLFGGGLLLSIFGIRLQEFMTGERK
ncbi:MAG: hypothetical protein GY832_09640 [Chloroflexi bacterium]|nr:hypothetical protein [Chloroflexota bacterium]